MVDNFVTGMSAIGVLVKGQGLKYIAVLKPCLYYTAVSPYVNKTCMKNYEFRRKCFLLGRLVYGI